MINYRPPCCSLPADCCCSLGCSLLSASGSSATSSASPRHRRRGTAEALSVQEPAQRFSCSRRLVLAESPILYPRRTVMLKIKHTLEGGDTPSMCILSLPGWLGLLCAKPRLVRVGVGNAQGLWRHQHGCHYQHTLAFVETERDRCVLERFSLVIQYYSVLWILWMFSFLDWTKIQINCIFYPLFTSHVLEPTLIFHRRECRHNNSSQTLNVGRNEMSTFLHW